MIKVACAIIREHATIGENMVQHFNRLPEHLSSIQSCISRGQQESVACVTGAVMNSRTSLPQWRTEQDGSSQPMKTFRMVLSPEQGAESGWTIKGRSGNI